MRPPHPSAAPAAPSAASPRHLLKSLYLLLWLAVPVLAQTAPEPPGIRDLNRIVAIVNDDVIVQSELDRRTELVLTELRRKGTAPPPPGALERQVLERLVLDRLQLQLAERTGIRVDETTLNDAISRIAAQNNLTVEQFRAALAKEDYDFGTFREEVRRELVIGQLRRRQVDNRVMVSEREVQDFLSTRAHQSGVDEEYRIAHILIAVPDGASPEQIDSAQRRAGDIHTRLREGADFRAIAVAESDGQQALDGGELGWRKGSQLPTLFADRVRSLKPGEISEPVRSPSGFHIVKLLETRLGEAILLTQTRARHILIKTDPVTTDRDARLRLDQLRTRILNGEDFGDLARAQSADATSAVRGGELGWVNPGDLTPEFERAMAGLAPGQLSEPFRSSFGWHLVEVLERRSHDGTDAVLKARAREVLQKRKIEEETETWLRRLRDEAYVEYRLEE